MQGLAAACAPQPEGPAPQPQPRVRLPPDSSMSIQDGWDPVEAARTGRLDSLQRLAEEGRFLDLHSPHRAAAGEACRAQAWLAALAACKAGHAHVLRWILRGGWPSSFDAEPPWHLADMADSWIKEFGTVPYRQCGRTRVWTQLTLPCYPPEVELYRCAMRAPACLDALLDAGARSAWICRAAVLEGRPDLLALSMERGCLCDAECVFLAARDGQLEVLEALLLQKVDEILESTNRVFRPTCNLLYRRPGWAGRLVQQAGMEAAARGQHACLEALLRWQPDLLCRSPVVAHAAARAGHLSCLQILHRGGLKEWGGTVEAAASKPDNLPCLRFAMQLEPPQRNFNDGVLSSGFAYLKAAEAGSLANLEALNDAGYPWIVTGVSAAVMSGKADVVKFCLEHGVGDALDSDDFWHLWDEAVAVAVDGRNPAIMQLLYDVGRPHWTRGADHVVPRAIKAGMLEGTQIAVKYSGVPEQDGLISTADAVRGGEPLLRYVHELFGTLDKSTAMQAAWHGQLGALQYAVQSGAHWDGLTLFAAIAGDSLDCLRYAHEGGCPRHMRGELSVPLAAQSLPVLRYVCEQMEPTWRAEALFNTAYQLSDLIRQADARETLDWQLALYTAQQFVRSGEPEMLWEDLPAPLAKAVLVRRERAGALAGAFYRAGQLGRVGVAHSWVPLWRSMASVPCELRQRIACMAHLVLP